ncbi:acetoacetate--CoA ligase [Hyunsoonleella pacifica]|uniref:Acetoacetate--CoA ligase n=1 Tax=Hyunsoonleella pacifica TaxID=1080224 RepID=A0A4Q9FQ34_9FLAO|nr:acetoacetate--CoA ligase [Hyunsoonleella pacifica]TBN16788.1 acetoacetate--CoA ligase [Hyunsoonleella pacifica]GGD16362.1 acetoacetyl-CoA synthetase [Hyunsoonleella pacifica]
MKKLWEGSNQFKKDSHLQLYCNWLKQNHNLKFRDYHELWEWSTNNIEDFWESIWQYFKIKSHSPYTKVLSSDDMPNCNWFEGATLNYAEHIFRVSKPNKTAIYFSNESGIHRKISWKALEKKVASMAMYFKSLGVTKGDRVVGFLPNIPEATIAFLAANAIGAVWSSSSPDFGTESVVNRFAQIEPKVLIAVDGYNYNGKPYDKTETVKEIVSGLSSLKKVVVLPYLNTNALDDFPEDYMNINSIFEMEGGSLEFQPVDFNHPIWVLYSSGTTGLPKAIVHSHGGILLEHYKYMAFHNDTKPDERYFWFTTTGWMMWNFLQSALLMGASMVLYDGSPTYPKFDALWRFSDKLEVNHFGTSAPFLVANMKKDINLKEEHNLSSIRSISSTGAPLPAEAFDYVYDNIKTDVWLCSMAGGTDVCTAFVGGIPFNPVYSGEIQCRALGVSLHALDNTGKPVKNELGEMVIDKPMPSMPIYFWNDKDNTRYKSSYFEDYPGKWRHGDFIKINSKTGGLVIYGRSDATLNRHGIRIGTSEIYSAVNKISAIEDSLIINLELDEGKHYMPLFIKLKSGFELSEDIKSNINNQLKTDYSPRHVPDEIIEVKDIPYTISGKKMEAPIKKILLKMPIETSINLDAMRNPESVNFFLEFAKQI